MSTRVLNIGGIPTSLGEIINIKFHLDMIKHQYDRITLSFHKDLWKNALHTESEDWPEKEKGWHKLLDDLGKLFFSEHPYVLLPNSTDFAGDMGVLSRKFKLFPRKAEMGHYLCKGTSLNLGEEYIVITTKCRQMNRRDFLPRTIKLWNILSRLSKKYKIVILGERLVEMRKEYGAYNDGVFGIYEELITNLPKDRIVDLTVPALGETVSSLEHIQQDCLIMKEAKLVITLGVGGNFCLATSVATMAVGYRMDNLEFTDRIFGRQEYPNAIITKDWNYFIQVLERYL